MNNTILHQIGSQIGEVEAIDLGECGTFMGRFARIRVNVTISDPLKRCITVDVSEGLEVVMVLCVYERLPEFCYACGRIGHQVKECDDTEADKLNLDYGALMRASSYQNNNKRRTFQEKNTTSDGSGLTSDKRASSRTESMAISI